MPVTAGTGTGWFYSGDIMNDTTLLGTKLIPHLTSSLLLPFQEAAHLQLQLEAKAHPLLSPLLWSSASPVPENLIGQRLDCFFFWGGSKTLIPFLNLCIVL